MIELIDYMLIGAGLGVAFCTYWTVLRKESRRRTDKERR